MPKVKGKVPARIAAELRYLGRERDEYLIAENFESALKVMDLYDRVYCRWYFENEETICE